MQIVAALSFNQADLKGAFLLNKNEVAALASACGPKRRTTRSDERSVWLDWRRGELITQDRTILVRLSDPRVSVDCDPLQLHVDALKAVATQAGAKDLIVVGEVKGVVALGIIEGRDVADHGDAVEPKAGTGVTFHDGPTDLVLSHTHLTSIIPEFDPNAERLGSFVWDSRFANTLARVAKATAKGQAMTIMPPVDGGPFIVTVEAGQTLDLSNRWDVVAMPLVPAE